MVTDVESDRSADTMKFLCSYGGKILPRSVDGKTRYVGGLTRILAVSRSISYTELMVKLVEFCGYSVELRCQLPDGDLEMLISIKSDEELALLIEEYHLRCPGFKIRAVLFPPPSLKTVSPPPSAPTSMGSYAMKSPFNAFGRRRSGNYPTAVGYTIDYRNSDGVSCNPFHGQGNPGLSCWGPYCNGQGNAKLSCRYPWCTGQGNPRLRCSELCYRKI